MCRSSETPLDRITSGLKDLPGWVAEQPAGQLGQVIIKSREIIDRTEAMAADATRRFEKAGGYRRTASLTWSPGYGSTANCQAARPPSVSRWPAS
ncbi:MAG TPA: hypothetical protein VF990_05470 [Candidatus Dormibacteraeota bacterium]